MAGDDDDGYVTVLAYLLENDESVHVREADIQDDNVGCDRLYEAYRVATVHARYDGGVRPPYREANPNRVNDFRYILDYDNSH